MNWKTKIENSLDLLRTSLRVIQALLLAQGKKLDDIKAHQVGVDKMADRVIAMSMVTRGSEQDAAIYRRAIGAEDSPESKYGDLWTDPEDEWPPPGCDTLSIP